MRLHTFCCKLLNYRASTLNSPDTGLDAYIGTVILLYSSGILTDNLTGGTWESCPSQPSDNMSQKDRYCFCKMVKTRGNNPMF